jgi:kumamolisin
MLQFRSSRHAIAATFFASVGTAILALPAAAEVPQILAAAAAAEKADFDLYFPIRDRAALTALIEAQNSEGAPEYHKWLTPQQFAQRFGPSSATIARVTAELAGRGLTVTAHQGQRLHVTGSAAAVEAAFGVHLFHGRFANGSEAMVANRAPVLPPALAASGARIPQFTTVPPHHKHSYRLGPVPQNFISSTGPYYTADLRQAYNYPSAEAITAKGVNIGILMEGDFNPPDITAYFNDELLPASLQPTVTSIPINGGLPYSTTNSFETHLDIQQSGGMSLAANITLYNLRDLSDATIMDGLNTINSDNVADVVSMSFGAPEADYLPANNGGTSFVYLIDMEDTLFLQGTTQGISFVASSGDHGAIPLVGAAQTPTLSAETPASDPYVVGVGGTNLVTTFVSASNDSAYVSENANFDTEPNGEVWGSGGGISVIFAKPMYQNKVPTQSATARTVPDVAGHMGGCPSDAVTCNTPDSADLEVIGGELDGVIGTSAAAPDFAGLVALKVALNGGTMKGRLGWANHHIYRLAKAQYDGAGLVSFHHKAIPGNNGFYTTTTPYDLVIGTGTAKGRQFLGAMNLPRAGIPGTPSNP